MPKFEWPCNPMEILQSFERRHQKPDASGLFAWAAWGLDALYYLVDMDSAAANGTSPAHQHDPAVIDVAHARWATSTCVTALDLCAAAFARTFVNHTGAREVALSDFDSRNKAKATPRLRGMLPAQLLTWIDGVLADIEYDEVKLARNALTHSRVLRHFTMGGRDQRLHLQVGTAKVHVREVIERARDVATRHILVLFQQLASL